MKRKISLVLSIFLGFSALTGCGEAAVVDPGRNIELIEPANASVTMEKVQRRSLYEAKVYEGAVYPYVEEYSFDKMRRFDSYAVYPGDFVKKGEILMYTTSEELETEIESLETRLQNLTESQQKYCASADEKYADLKEQKEYAQWVLGNLEDQKDESEYNSWNRDYVKWTGTYKKAELDMDILNYERDEKTALYNLEYEYYDKQLQELLAEREASVLRSKMDGQIVAIQQFYVNQRISMGTPAIAVADMSQKYIKCEYLTPRVVESAQEVYAFVNGKRYELTYEKSENEECSTFKLMDENNETSVGEYAVLVLMTNGAKDALTLSNGAIHQDVTKKYVHVQVDGNIVSKEVTTGISDGQFTEILSGLEEGDEVVVSEMPVAGEYTAVLEKGTFMHTYAYAGDMYYPIRWYQQNPHTYVTTRFVEYAVQSYQQVKKGDVLMRIYTEGDPRALEEKETELAREKARLADLISEKNEANAERIASWQERIAELEEVVATMKKEYTATEFVAEQDAQISTLWIMDENRVIQPNGTVMNFVDTSKAYIIAESKGFINYGTKLEVMYTSMDDQLTTSTGTVVTLGDYGVSSSLAADGVLVVLDDGNTGNIKEMTPMDTPGHFRSNAIKVQGNGKVMEDVILIPTKAVVEIDGNTYVNVILEDGTVTIIPFLSGGNSRTYYWAVDGLDEGMTVCW